MAKRFCFPLPLNLLLGGVTLLATASVGFPREGSPAAGDGAAEADRLVTVREFGGLAAEFSGDGRRLLTAGQDGARLYDGGTYAPAGAPMSEPAPLTSARLAADGRVLTTAGRRACVWDAVAGKRLLALDHPDDGATDAAADAQGRRLATACADGSVRLWDAATGELLAAVRHDHPARSVTFSPDARLLAVRVSPAENDGAGAGPPHPLGALGGEGDVVVWEVGERSLTERWSKGGARGRPAFSPDGRMLSVCLGWRGVFLFDAATGAVVCRWLRGNGYFGYYVTQFSRDGSRLLVAGDDGADAPEAAVRVLHFIRGERGVPPRLEQLLGVNGNTRVRAAALSPDGRYVAASPFVRHADGTRPLAWSVDTGRPAVTADDQTLRTWAAHGSTEHVVAFSPDGGRLVVGRPARQPGSRPRDPDGGPSETTVWRTPTPP